MLNIRRIVMKERLNEYRILLLITIIPIHKREANLNKTNSSHQHPKFYQEIMQHFELTIISCIISY